MFYRNPNYNNINGSFYPSNNSFIQPAPNPILVNPPITSAVVAPSPPNIIAQNPPPLFPTELPGAGFGASRTYLQKVDNYNLGTTNVLPIPPPPGARKFNSSQFYITKSFLFILSITELFKLLRG